MSLKIRSDALATLQRSFGITGSGSMETVLEDASVYQTVDISKIALRGRTQAGTTGLYAALIQNVHPGVGQLNTTVDVYDPPAGVVPPYPAPVPEAFDVWILGATVRRFSGTGSVDNGIGLYIDYPVTSLGWGINNSGAAVVPSTIRFPLVMWDSFFSNAGFSILGLREDGQPWQQIGLRMPKGATLTFASSVDAIATVDCFVQLGVFPSGLGQDGIA